MRIPRDTFLHYLADNLPALTVKNLRRDVNNPDAIRVTTEALNVQFIEDAPNVHIGSITVLMDVISADELTAVDMMNSVWQLLSLAGYTPQLDYSTTPPTQLASNLFWNPNTIKFRPVWDDLYTRYSALLRISLHPY
jgi:hypothetical protein